MILPMWLTAVVALGLVVAAVPAPPLLPNTPQGRLAARWFEAFNGDDAAFRAFLERDGAPSERPLEERLERWRAIRADHRPLTPVRLIGETPGRTTVLARDRAGELFAVTLESTPGEAPKLGGIGFESADEGTPPAPGRTPLTEAQVVDSVRVLAGALASDGRFAGVVRLEHDGRVVLEQAWGEADRERHVAHTTATAFNLGSINKTFTRAVIAKLAEMGKLDPADTLSKHLPDFPRDKADRITIQQLLDMRSGLGDFFGPRYDAMDRSKLRTLRDWLPLFVDQPLEFEPGTSRRYSNAGYLVLGLVAEQITGRSYYDLVRDWVYAPAGMKDSDSYPLDGRGANVAFGYTRRGPGATPDAPLKRNDDWLPARGSSAGGGYATAADLSRFARALYAGRILAPATLAKFYSTATGPDGRGSLVLGAAGGSPGCNAVLETQDGWTIIVLANLDPPAAESLARRTRAWIEGVAPPQPLREVRSH